MSHESNQNTDNKSGTLNASFWFVLILVGLFIAAVNFINVMGHDEGGHDTHGTEAPHHPKSEAAHEGATDGSHH